MRYEYSASYDPLKTARAQTFDKDVSYKDLTQVCNVIRGKPVSKAVSILENAISGEYAVRYALHGKGIGHRSELGGKRGRYPKKAAKLTLRILQNAFANAQSKGLDEKNIVVVQASAYKQNVYPRYRRYFASGNVLGYGKHAAMSQYTTARLELVVGAAGSKPIARPTKKQAKVLAKQKQAKAAADAAKKASAPAAKKEESKEAKAAESKEKSHEHDHKHQAKEPSQAREGARPVVNQRPSEPKIRDGDR